MENTKIMRAYFIGATFLIIISLLLHFLYAWSSGENNKIAIFGMIDESSCKKKDKKKLKK